MAFVGLSKEAVFVRADLTRKLAKQKSGSVDAVATNWAPPDGADASSFPPAPSESTVNSWISKGFPSKLTGLGRYHFLAFCAQLDVDPLAIFDFRLNGYFSKFAAIRKAVQRGMGSLGAFAPIFELFEPDEFWPSDLLATRLWGKPWHTEEFDNTIEHKLHSYALLKFKFSKPSDGNPRAVHIAYRRWSTRASDSMWRYYGTVIAIDDRIELYNENAVHLKTHRSNDDVIEFRTFFGGRHVQFKVASLHKFDMEKLYPFDDMSVIGFDW